ncbi:MAG: oligoendopeptidase F [Acidobacteriota bacterium]
MPVPLHLRVPTVLVALLLALAAPAAAPVLAEGRTTWDLTPIYPDAEAWEKARQAFERRLPEMDAFKGRLGESPQTLKQAFDLMFDLQKEALRLYGYANLEADLDLRAPGPQGRKQTMQMMLADLQARFAWIDPELLSIPAERLASFFEQEPGLAPYRRYVERLEKRRPHVLSPEIEEVLGQTGRLRGEGATIGSLLRNAEIPWPTITLSTGEELVVDVNGYSKGRASQVREDRIATYKAFYDTLQRYAGTFAATLAATVNEHVFDARVRKYGSTLEASLAANEVDPAVYRMLVDEINAGLPTLHRYLRLRARMLGIDDLRYHDMYPPLVPEISADYSWETSKRLVLEALAPLGSDYVRTFAGVLDAGWVDVFPRPGKRSGAYVSDIVYDVHPYMLLNHIDDYQSMSTLAHEGGHLMHSILSQRAQPYPTADYVIFVAEVASTVNEVLLFEDLLSKAKTDDERLALLGHFLEGMRQTVYRQTQFAEFELAMHELAEQGRPLTAESLNGLYGDLLRRYYGEKEGVTKIDDLYAVEWAFIPHFHYNYYVYQYATSYVAAVALAQKILAGEPGARDRYLAFLSAGSSKPPVELLREAGVDMTRPEPIRAALAYMDGVIGRIEQILDRRAD